jgi:2-oxoglutarate dehydrogenase complex dehydrogenase (E1) component-like enzyme
MAGVDVLASAFSGANAAFLGEQYARWAGNPASVDPTFAELFSALNDDARAVLEEATGASWAPTRRYDRSLQALGQRPPRLCCRPASRSVPTRSPRCAP